MWPFSTLIRDSAAAAGAEERSVIDFSAFSGLITNVDAGVSVTQTNCVNLPAVYKCIELNAQTIASLPIDVYSKRGDTREPRETPGWLREPNALQTQAEFVAMTQTSLDIAGNAYWLKASDGGLLVGLSVLSPSAVTPEVRNGELIYWVDQDGGSRKPYASNTIIHLRGLTLPGSLTGLSPIECARQTIGVGRAAEKFAGNFFGRGATMSGVVETPGSLTQEQADAIKEQMQSKHGGVSKSHALGVLSGGATWKQLSVRPNEAQFLETRRYTAVEIANLYGVPPEMVADVDGAKGYVTALHARLRLWYLTGLLPRITRIEKALSDLMVRPAYVKFNTNALLRMDPAERTAFYQAAQLGEWMTRNEIRALEDMDPIAGGDEPLHSVQWQENASPGDGATDDGDEAA